MRSFDQVKSWNRLYVLIGVLVFVLLVLAPSFFRDKFREGTKLAEYWISKPIQLGLDLVGGVYILFEVDQAKFLDQLRSLKINEIRNVLKKNEIPVLSYEKQNDTAIFRFVTEKSLLKAETSLEQAGYKILLSDKTKKELHVKLDVLEFEKAVAEAALKAVETIRARIDQFGVSEPVVQRIGLNRVLVELPGVKDLQRVKQVIGKTARLEFRFLPRTKDVKTVKMPLANTGELIEVEDEVVLTGDTIQKANVEFTPTDGAVVAIQFNFEGAREFARITRENREKNLAIIMDGVVYSAPQIQTAITEGSAIITGLRSPEEARELSIVLKSGTLPAPLTIIEERLVGPSLGEVYIQRAIYTLISSFVIVSVVMIILYGKFFGLVSSLSLALACLLIISCLVLLQATLTFPGLAAIALTIGIAVDSNIIIFERIKDALKEKVSFLDAVERGFANAYSAIFDANITSLLTSLIVYFLAHGPIKGFAITFAIGTLVTLFCAVFVGKTLIFCFSSNKSIQT